jgi:hypothetical protein
MEMLETRAQTIRDTVGVSLDDMKAEQEQAVAAQRTAETENEGPAAAGCGSAGTRQSRRPSSKQKLPENRRKRLSRYDWRSSRNSSRRKSLNWRRRKEKLAKEKIDVAEKAAELAQKRLEVTTYRLESERKGRTATEILNTYEWAKGEAAKAANDERSARAAAELAKQGMESLRREAELAQLKAQVERNHSTGQAPIRSCVHHACLGGKRASGQDRPRWRGARDGGQDRARVASDRQLYMNLKLSCGATFEISTLETRTVEDYLGRPGRGFDRSGVAPSALIIGVSTLPEQLIDLGTYLADPMHFWRIVGQVCWCPSPGTGCGLRSVTAAKNCNHSSPGKKTTSCHRTVRSYCGRHRLIAAVSLPLMLSWRVGDGVVAAGGRKVFVVFGITMGGSRPTVFSRA